VQCNEVRAFLLFLFARYVRSSCGNPILPRKMARVSTRVSTTSVTQMNGVNNGGGTNSGASSGNTKNG